MKFKTIAEAFNHYRTSTLEEIECRAAEIKFILTLWYHAERVDADKIQRTIDSLLKTLQLKAERG